MGITIHYKAKATEKQVDANTKYWMETVPKLKLGAPEGVFPGEGVSEIKRFEKIRDARPEEKVLRPDIGLTEEDMWNDIYGTGYTRTKLDGTVIKIRPQYGKTDHCKGVMIHQMDGCEWVNFRFCKTDKGWQMNAFTKTQYCGVPGHILTCKILEEAKSKFFPDMKIDDEGDYCGNRNKHDIEKLKESLEGNAIMIDQVAGMLRGEWKDDMIVTGGEMALRKSRSKSKEVI